jgi:hypothetical protein
VKELQGFLSRASSQYLSLFKWADVVTEWFVTIENRKLILPANVFCSVKPAAERCLDLFVRFACLIRPIGTLGRLKLAADFAQVQIMDSQQI